MDDTQPEGTPEVPETTDEPEVESEVEAPAEEGTDAEASA